MISDSCAVKPTASNSEISSGHIRLDSTICSAKSNDTIDTVNSFVARILDAESFRTPLRPRAIEIAMEGGLVETPIK